MSCNSQERARTHQVEQVARNIDVLGVELGELELRIYRGERWEMWDDVRCHFVSLYPLLTIVSLPKPSPRPRHRAGQHR